LSFRNSLQVTALQALHSRPKALKAACHSTDVTRSNTAGMSLTAADAEAQAEEGQQLEEGYTES